MEGAGVTQLIAVMGTASGFAIGSLVAVSTLMPGNRRIVEEGAPVVLFRNPASDRNQSVLARTMRGIENSGFSP